MEYTPKQFIHSLKYADYINSQSEINTDCENFKCILKSYPDVVNKVFEEYNEFYQSLENFLHLIRYYPVQLDFDINHIKKILAEEKNISIVDACLQMLETYSMDHDLDILFVRDYTYSHKWLTEYANSISE